METTHLDIAVCEENVTQGALAVLAHIRPSWPSEQINFKVFTNGITNKLIGCWTKENANDIVLIRIYGQNTDLLIDREAETKNFKLLQKAGYAPQLYSIFLNGLAYEYVPGEILDVLTVRCPKVYPLVAKMLAKVHLVKCEDNKPVLWDKLKKYLSLVPNTYSSAVKQTLFAETFPEGISLLHSEVQILEQELSHLKSKVVFCHNDLLLANIIHNNRKVTFIDYEYAACNYQAYDIGNHFAEFAGVSNVDYSYYPDRDLQYEWLKIYLEEFNSQSGVTQKEIEDLYVQVNKFALVSHVFWALWALVQAEHSTIEFDFIGYVYLICLSIYTVTKC